MNDKKRATRLMNLSRQEALRHHVPTLPTLQHPSLILLNLAQLCPQEQFGSQSRET